MSEPTQLYRKIIDPAYGSRYEPVDLTSPETIEKAARAYADHMGWVYEHGLDNDKMDAVLRAVSEDTR